MKHWDITLDSRHRSSCPDVFYKVDLRNFAKFTRKTPVLVSPFLIQIRMGSAQIGPLLVFPCNFYKELLLQGKHLYFIILSLKFMYSRKQSQYLHLIPHVSHFLSSCLCLHLILWISSERLLTRFNYKLAINLPLKL